MRASFPRPLLAAVLLGCCAGCLPNATWLPDSSGFVYTGGKDKDTLSLYDLAKKAPHVLVEKGAGPAWPAVSPDGKRIAVALRTRDGGNGFIGKAGASYLEVIVFDRDGKELQRSEKMKWSDDTTGADQVAAQVFWIPGQDKLLLDTDGVTGFYDLKTKSNVLLDVTLSTYRNTPIRPDGKGFLAVLKNEDKGLAFVDWDGAKHNIELTPKDAFDDHKSDALTGMVFFPMMHSSRWDGSTAIVTWDDLRFKIDAEKRTATLATIKPAMSEDDKVIQDQVKLAGGAVVRAVELTKRYAKEPPASGGLQFGSYRLEVVKPGAKAPKVLMDEAGFFLIDPSPDGKKAVVKCAKSLDAMFKTSSADEDMLFVIGADGDVTDKIDLSK